MIMPGRTHPSPVRPSRAGVSVESRLLGDGTERCYARYTDPRGVRRVVKAAGGGST